MKKVVLWIALVLVLIIPTVLGILFFKSVEPYNTINAFAQGELNIVIEDKPVKINKYPIVNENMVLVPVEIVKDYIYPDLELSEKYNRVYIKANSSYFSLGDKKLDEKMSSGLNVNFLTRNIDGTEYLNIVGLEKILNIDFKYIEDTDILTIDRIQETLEKGTIKKSTYLRPKKTSFGFKIDKLKKGDEVIVFDKSDKWLKVRTDKGYVGYVLKKKVEVEKEERDIDRVLAPIHNDEKIDGKINLVWDHISKYSPDLSEKEKIEGLDIISPTWFSIVDENGYIVNNGDIKYVRDAHEKGYKVWTLIDNSFDKDLTREILANEEAQENVINQLLFYSRIYDIDGINIDFENVYYEDKDNLTVFIDRLTDVLKSQNIVVSMDMTVPYGSKTWSRFYDRKRLGEIVDYCIVMTYDEHWASSPKSGSVASIGWVAKGIENSLDFIDHDKLIMGIPFYTRQWEEIIDEKGNTKVESKALSMAKVREIIEENNCNVVWLEDTGQYYTEYMKDGKKYRIWIEDERSVELKAKLIYKYNLAGVASWRKGFEEEEIWTVLNDVVKENKKLVVKN